MTGLVLAVIAELLLGHTVGGQAAQETDNRAVGSGVRPASPSVGFPEHFRGHLQVVQGMAFGQHRLPAEQLEDGEVRSRLG